MKKGFTGPLAAFIQRHLQLRRSLGYQLEHAERLLPAFDQYLSEHFPQAATVTRAMVVGYLETTRHLHPRSRAGKVSILRQFCRFLFQLNPDTYIPEPHLVPRGKTTVQPHLYSLAEVTALMQAARQLPPAAALRPHTFATLIGLLWVSGLRIGEALRLTLQDVDLEQGILQIRQTKFFKSRLVPLAPSTVAALKVYRRRRHEKGYDDRATAPFFINQRGRPFAYETVQGTFWFLRRQLGLKSLQGRDPRLHDFRHSFATRSLTELYQTGKDPNAYLPVLATYLGHVNLAGTTVYLHPAIELLAIAGARFAGHVERVRNLALGGAYEGR